MNDDILRLAREAGLSHVYDSEQDFSGVTDALLVDADKQRNDKRLVEILGPLVALVRADERERIKAANAPVIQRINEHLEKMREDIRARSKT